MFTATDGFNWLSSMRTGVFNVLDPLNKRNKYSTVSTNEQDKLLKWEDLELNTKNETVQQQQHHHHYQHEEEEISDGEVKRSGGTKNYDQSDEDEDMFGCTLCNKKFRKHSGMVRHFRTHTGERPFKCGYPGCNRRFSERGNATRHRRIHTKERNYSCPIPNCEVRFTRKDHVLQHLTSSKHDQNDPLTKEYIINFKLNTHQVKRMKVKEPANDELEINFFGDLPLPYIDSWESKTTELPTTSTHIASSDIATDVPFSLRFLKDYEEINPIPDI